MGTDLGNQIRELIDGGTPPVSLQEISRRRAPAARRHARRRRTLITVAATSVAAAGCAAGLAVAFASPGAPARPVAQASPSASPSSQGPVFLTAATLRQVASASRAALGSSGVERISYRTVKNGAVDGLGADTVTYSGRDYIYAVSQTVPAGVIPGGSIRVVNGQFYILVPGSPWLHEVGENTSPTFPEAATLVRLLSPAAHFQNTGTDVIGGVRLTHLHATQVGGLPAVPTLTRYANLNTDLKKATVQPGTLMALDVWVDSSDVVHQMKVQVDGGDGHTTITVMFIDSGQPQSITAPPHSLSGPGNP